MAARNPLLAAGSNKEGDGDAKKSAPAERTSKETSKRTGTEARRSRQKAEGAATRTERAIEDGTDVPFVPRASDGRPLTRVSFQGAELIPHGDYANISNGPAKVEMWIDPRDPEPIKQEDLDGIGKAMNQMADVVFMDVMGVQRVLIQESIEKQVAEELEKNRETK